MLVPLKGTLFVIDSFSLVSLILWLIKKASLTLEVIYVDFKKI